MFCAKVYAASLGFGGGGDNCFDILAEYVNCAVGFVFVCPDKILDCGCADLVLGKYEERSVGDDIEDHVDGVVTYDAFRVSVQLVHGHIIFDLVRGGGFGLFGSNIVESR